MKAIRKLIQEIMTVEYSDREAITIGALLDGAKSEIEAVETTFAEIAKLQQRILGDSKTIGGTANNKPMAKFPTADLELRACTFFNQCPVPNKGHVGCYSTGPCFK